MAGRDIRGASIRSCSPRSHRRTSRWHSSAVRPRLSWPSRLRWWRSGTSRAESGPSASARREVAEMDELTLDGNAVAGLLAEVFAAEMTTARGTCNHCGAVEPVGAVRVYRAAGFVLRCP